MTTERLLIGWKAAVHDRKIASLRYRVETPVRALQALGHAVEVFDPDREAEYDVVIFAKTYSLQDRALAGRVRARGGRVVFDLCDNHFYNPDDLPKYRQVREELLDMLSLAQQVVCTTPPLAEVVRQEAPWAADPVVIGDAVEHVAPTRPSLEPFEGLRLLWFGSQGSPNAPAGMADILEVKAHLLRLAQTHPVELVVCSNSQARFEELIEPLPLRTRYVEWTLAGFNGVLASADAVIIPISANPFTACKTNNRLTTALDAAVPVIADSIESYREFAPFCTLDDWAGGLERLVRDPEGERARAAAGRDYLLQRWTAEVLALRWEETLGLATERPVAVEAAGLQDGDARRTPERRPEPVNGAASRLCQGALDRRGAGAVGGWVRAVDRPQSRLVVRLFADGEEVASSLANQPRPDLASAGFAEADYGFALAVPADRPGAVLDVKVDGYDWRFPEGAFQLSGDLQDGFRLLPSADSSFSSSIRTTTVSSEAAHFAPGASTAALDVQAELLDQLEALEELMQSAREAAARLIIAAGDDASLGRRLLGLFDRNLKPELRRVVSWGENVEGPLSPLN